MSKFEQESKGYVYEGIYQSIHPGSSQMLKLAQQKREHNGQAAVWETGEKLSQNVFMQLELAEYEDYDILLCTDAENVVYEFDMATAELVEKQMQLRLKWSALGNFGEVLSICELDENKIAFSASTNKVVIYDMAAHAQQLLFGHDEPVTHVQMRQTPYGKVLVSVSEDRINFYVETAKEEEKPAETDKKTLEMLFQEDEVKEVETQDIVATRCVIELQPESKQISAVCFYAQDTRQLLLYAQGTKIHLVELTRMLLNWSKNRALFQSVDCARVQTSITAHLDTINDIQVSPKQYVVTSSADKSVAIWSFNRSVEKAAEERVTIYDIFSNKVNNKFQLAVDRTNSRLQLMRQLPNAARRANWGVAINSF